MNSGKVETYGDDEYEVMTDPNLSDDDCTSVPTFSDMDDEGTQDDFSDEGDPFTSDHDGTGFGASASDSQLTKHRGSAGTSSEMGARPSKTKPTLSKTTSASHLPAKPKFMKRPIPYVPHGMEKPKLSKNDVQDLADALHYVVFFPLEHLWDLQHSPQTLLFSLRTALGISDAEQLSFLDRILPTCNYEHILVLLNRQVQSIAQHKFYAPNAFPNPEMYNNWKDGELQRIQRLIDRIYNSNDGIEPTSESGPAPYDRFLSLDFHQLFRQLNKVLHYADSLSKQVDHKVSVLSLQSTWLLKEFGERYQVNPLFRSLSMLDILVNFWSPSSPRLAFLQFQLLKLQQMLQGRTTVGISPSTSIPLDDDDDQVPKKVSVSIPELAFMKSIFLDLNERISDSFNEFYLLSRGSSDGPSPLKSLLAILQITIDLEAVISSDDRDFHESLYEMIREGISNMYGKLLACAGGRTDDDDGSDNSADENQPFTPNQMITAAQMISEELKVLASGAAIFDFDVVALAARGFMKWYHEDLVRFCAESATGFPARDLLEVSSAAYQLGIALSQAADNLKVPVNLGGLFESVVNQYLIETLNQQRSRIDAAIEEDQWAASSDELLCSTRLPDLLGELASPLKIIQKYDFFGAGVFETRFGTYVVDPVLAYLGNSIFRSFLQSLPGCTSKLAAKLIESIPPPELSRQTADLVGLVTKIHKLRPDVSISEGSFKASVCVRINSLAAVPSLIQKCFTYPPSSSAQLSQVFTSTLSSVSATSERFYNATLIYFAAWIYGDLAKSVKAWLKKGKGDGDEIKPILHIYFNVINRALVPHLALILIQSLWKIILASIRDHFQSMGKFKPKDVEKARPCLDGLLDIVLSLGFSQFSADFKNQLEQLFSELSSESKK